ncbi:uncharacterized protein M421DRAFT_2569 [Didymella exigua CBS 183.55]|uniref:FAD-binding FR-type domain-containing protein n=1 Tax=Didymella exigua CBS 183.55 TaxID=1150837 RepID=A0A6A5RWJ5_9PLEO|nr:uncharacterized protein M421DRAFT_2569 [Didymella exigua CBS 183.55]KAF1931963.1 hypothetical protein M421DRAFT_2569 [Didymella exigua CBS 183.55]
MNLPGGQLAHAERNRPRCGTNETFDSTSTFIGSERCDKWTEVKAFEYQLSADDSLSSHPASATGDETGQPFHEQATPRRWQSFCLHWLTAYRVLIFVIILINVGTMIAQLVANPAVEASLTAAAVNIMTAVVLRQEDLINFSFKLISKLPPSLPLSIRKTVSDFHHYGGAHIGCALSAMLWYIMFTRLNTGRVLGLLSLGHMTALLYIDIVTSYTVLLAILVVCLTAIPRFRARFHNTFEATHRFGGWATLIILWMHAGITTLTPDASVPLYAHPSLWLLALTTLLLVLPWLRIRSVPITAHRLSARELELSFPHARMPHTCTLRFSSAPLTEWHAFATIPASGSTSKIIVSKAGDWTARVFANPPERLWIRDPPTLNFLAFVPLFKAVLLVATGAGIAPVLSLLCSPAMQRMNAERRKVRVMWCVADPYAAHWSFAMEAIKGVDKQAVVFDSRVARPDVAFETRWLAERANVEAVFVVSNPRVTNEVVRECKVGGLAAYGAVFDS